MAFEGLAPGARLLCVSNKASFKRDQEYISILSL